MDEELPEGLEEQIALRPVKQLQIICSKCKKELDLKSTNLNIDFDHIECTTVLFILIYSAKLRLMRIT